jgi:hypothetical protein
LTSQFWRLRRQFSQNDKRSYLDFFNVHWSFLAPTLCNGQSQA